MVSPGEVVYRLRRVPPGRVPLVVGRYALRTARARARRWRMQRARGELPQTALRGVSAEHVFEQLRTRFVLSPAEITPTARAIASRYPHLAQRTLARAEDALQHVVDLLGSGPVRLGERIDWHRDFKTGLRWPADVLAEDQDYLRLGEPCDVKVPWELSRAYHWVTLGRAYALEPDPRYATEFVNQLAAWLEDNPWPYGVNWGRAMEVAVRAVNWLWAAALFADAPEFSAAHKARFVRALLQHARHIIDNLEFADVNGNHYLSNGVGLLYLGIVLAELPEAATWRTRGLEIVWGEILHQVHPDGVDFEQGLGYQGMVAEFWYSCVRLCERNHIAVPGHVRERLGRMFDVMLACSRPDGTFPQIGDNDDGRLANLDEEPVGAYRRHLAVGGMMFERADLLAKAGDAVETAAWLYGADAAFARVDASRADGPSRPGNEPSRAFRDGGLYVMRAPDLHLVIDAGEVGMRGIGGHGHADVLAFDLWAAGADVLVDSGTYTYTADPAARNALRGTAAHNVLRVDGQDSSRLGGDRWLWLMENDAHPREIAWTSDMNRDVFQGTHDGYRRLARPVDHTRRIELHKPSRTLTIDDTLNGSGEHLVELFFHPGVPFEQDGGAVRLRAPHADLWLFPPPGMAFRQEPGWLSRGYGLREPATVLVYATTATVPLGLRTRLILVERDTPASVARSMLEPI